MGATNSHQYKGDPLPSYDKSQEQAREYRAQIEKEVRASIAESQAVEQRKITTCIFDNLSVFKTVRKTTNDATERITTLLPRGLEDTILLAIAKTL